MADAYAKPRRGPGGRWPIGKRAMTDKERCQRMRAAMVADPCDPRHGSQLGYKYGCRCDRCREAHAAYLREHRPRPKQRVLLSRHDKSAMRAMLLAGVSPAKIAEVFEIPTGMAESVLRVNASLADRSRPISDDTVG